MRLRHSFFMPSLYRVHPSPSSSSSCSPFHSSVIKLLPPEIQSEVSDLPLEDLEVLAYLMKRSLSPSQTQKKIPSYDFEYYGSFWNRWDSSPNRNLISKAIDAYEENLDSGAGDQGRKGGGKKKKDRKGERAPEKRLDFDGLNAGAGGSPGIQETWCSTGNEVALLPPEKEVQGKAADSGVTRGEVVVVRGGAPPAVAADMNRGLARKVLPDVVGIFNSRLWNLWRPKV